MAGIVTFITPKSCGLTNGELLFVLDLGKETKYL